MKIIAAAALLLALAHSAQAQLQGQWTETGALQTPRESDGQAALANARVLAAGGYDASGNILASAEIFAAGKSAWTFTGSMAAPREAFPAVTLTNGKVLVSGGYGAGGVVLGGAELFNPKTNSWTSAGSLAVPQYAHSATLLSNGKVLVTGGCLDAGCASLTAVSELYNPATNSWSVTGSLALPRAYQSAMLLDTGAVLVIGGYGAAGPTTATELYNPKTAIWTAAASTGSARYLAGASKLPDGKVLVSGGVIVKYPMNSAELYDPAANTWTPTGAMTTGRYAHSSTTLPDGTVLLAGGQGQSISCGKACTGYIPTATAEIFTEATLSFKATTPLHRAIAYQATTLLSTGQALTAGGSGFNAYCCQVIGDAQYYVPLSLGFSATSLNFGFLQTGLTSPSQTVTVTNASTHPVAFAAIAASGDYTQTNTCPASLAPSQSCAIAVTFTPTAAGARGGAITITDNSPGSPTQTIALTGTGETLALAFSPTALNLGSIAVGSTGLSSTTLINDGAGTITITAIAITPGGKTFTQTNNCPAVLNSQQSCTVQVVFTPPDVFTYNATLSATNSAGAAPTATLTGTGVDGGGG